MQCTEMNSSLLLTLLLQLFPGESGLAACPIGFPSPFIHRLCILLGQAQTFHKLLTRVPESLSWTTPVSSSINLHSHTALHAICIILTFNMSKPS